MVCTDCRGGRCGDCREVKRQERTDLTVTEKAGSAWCDHNHRPEKKESSGA